MHSHSNCICRIMPKKVRKRNRLHRKNGVIRIAIKPQMTTSMTQTWTEHILKTIRKLTVKSLNRYASEFLFFQIANIPNIDEEWCNGNMFHICWNYYVFNAFILGFVHTVNWNMIWFCRIMPIKPKKGSAGNKLQRKHGVF